MSEEKDSYDALALVSKGIIERLERELLEAKEVNRELDMEIQMFQAHHRGEVERLEKDLREMTQLAMEYKDANNRLEAKLNE